MRCDECRHWHEGIKTYPSHGTCHAHPPVWVREGRAGEYDRIPSRNLAIEQVVLKVLDVVGEAVHRDMCDEYASLKAERDALLAEHEAWTAWRTGEPSTSRKDWNRLTNAHNNAERVIRGE